MAPIRVHQVVAEQLEAIRVSGETNMVARNVVQVIAYRKRFYELVVFCDDKARYATAIFCGITVAADDEPVAEDGGQA